ncbi:MAG: polyphenol oxidase family protein, partial [Acidobacteriota bacterium]
ALKTTRTDLALCVATADCVPVVIASDTAVAVVHAGWRGVASRIGVKSVAAMSSAPENLSAWIGPAIGACCYEVGFDVAEQVAAASSPEVLRDRPGSRPKIDLSLAIRCQLLDAGLKRIDIVECCTRCNEAWLWSYRRDGERADRNLTFAWLNLKQGNPGDANGDGGCGESGRSRVT